MITYSNAKRIALKVAKSVGVTINAAKEWPEGYSFYNSDIEMEGTLPFIVLKENGQVMSYSYIFTFPNGVKGKEIPF